MGHGVQNEERILKELRSLPQEALPKILRCIALLKQEFLRPDAEAGRKSAHPKTDHKRIQKLLASSKTNWAKELIIDREDRL
jgi:hypothetical protein